MARFFKTLLKDILVKTIHFQKGSGTREPICKGRSTPFYMLKFAKKNSNSGKLIKQKVCNNTVNSINSYLPVTWYAHGMRINFATAASRLVFENPIHLFTSHGHIQFFRGS